MQIAEPRHTFYLRCLTTFRRLTALVLLGLLLSAPDLSAKPQLTVESVTSSATLPAANPAFKHPNDLHQVFFLQRNSNANTIVWVAQFDPDGRLNPDRPIAGYWRRFAGRGHVMAFRWYERVFGFGTKSRELADGSGFEVRFNGIKSEQLLLKQNGPFDAALYTRQNGRDLKMIYGYLEVDESGLLPKVVRLRLYTSDPKTGQYSTHTIAVSGGAFRE
ncbi:DUF4833 domain-containing protein [Shimia sp. Alg240-R146]|uniref:DUF4833 domain-containing protein n=1 Tax=Shimia sp. Alg240-R146 TaxID=2993449 RepID=UPI0022E1DE90|nr:DUF4833 domain-containing protein [Shimia sp. Alg240-R146]